MLRRAIHTTALRRAIGPGLNSNIMPKRKSTLAEEAAAEPARRRSVRLQKPEDVTPEVGVVGARKRVKSTAAKKEAPEPEVEEVPNPRWLSKYCLPLSRHELLIALITSPNPLTQTASSQITDTPLRTNPPSHHPQPSAAGPAAAPPRSQPPQRKRHPPSLNPQRQPRMRPTEPPPLKGKPAAASGTTGS